MTTTHAKRYTTGFVTSRDGATIGYRRMGSGPGVILLHGGMQAARNFMRLATALSDSFTAYVPDRRGRGLSGPFGDDHGMEKEVQDLEALMAGTGARDVFGLSAGALIALQATLTLPSLGKVALYEPPLAIGGDASMMAWVPRYEKELARRSRGRHGLLHGRHRRRVDGQGAALRHGPVDAAGDPGQRKRRGKRERVVGCSYPRPSFRRTVGGGDGRHR